MFSYVSGFKDIHRMLKDFLEHGIDVNRLDLLDRAIASSEVDQIKITNSYCSLVEQRILFGATRNINNVLKVMKERLKTAKKTHENPTAIELSLEIIEPLSKLAPYIDEFITNGELGDINRTNELSRVLYKKANSLGFYRDVSTQFKEIGITTKEVKTFVETLKENIELELETEDEPLNEDNSGNISPD